MQATEASTATEALAEQLPEFADYLPDQIRPAWDTIANYPILQAMIIAAVFLLLAYSVRTLVLRSLTRLASASNTTLDNQIIEQVRTPIFNTIFFFGLTLATRTAQLPLGSDAVVNILLSLIIFNWISGLLNLSGVLLEALSRNHSKFAMIEERTVPLIELVAKIMIMLVGGYVLLLIWGINPMGWLASAGIVGIALGFAAKDTLANLFSGFFILADSPYQIGDYVNLDSGERGRVTNIGMRSTRLLTRDDVEITLPNAVIANSKIINESGGPTTKMRLRINVGVAYGSDLDEVCAVLAQVADANPEMLAQPAPRVRMRAFGASSLDFQLMGWIDKPEDRGRISHELMMAIYKAFAAAEIEIPFAQTDVHIKQMPGFDPS
jgi:small-conductance mechanosensitive channel